MKEEVDAFKTVDCLRGRLQAERAASRAAADNAHLLAKKLTELEKQLKLEIKCRRKAEKKLRFLKKKLESLNIPCSAVIREENEMILSYSSSNNSETTSCMSSSNDYCTSNDHHQQEAHQIPESEASKCSSISNEIAGETVTESQIIVTSGRQNSDENGHGIQEPTLEEKSHENKKENEENQDDQVDDSMALVPVRSIVELNERPIIEAKGENVVQVLDSLKKIREDLQSSLDRNLVINLG